MVRIARQEPIEEGQRLTCFALLTQHCGQEKLEGRIRRVVLYRLPEDDDGVAMATKIDQLERLGGGPGKRGIGYGEGDVGEWELFGSRAERCSFIGGRK